MSAPVIDIPVVPQADQSLRPSGRSVLVRLPKQQTHVSAGEEAEICKPSLKNIRTDMLIYVSEDCTMDVLKSCPDENIPPHLRSIEEGTRTLCVCVRAGDN